MQTRGWSVRSVRDSVLTHGRGCHKCRLWQQTTCPIPVHGGGTTSQATITNSGEHHQGTRCLPSCLCSFLRCGWCILVGGVYSAFPPSLCSCPLLGRRSTPAFVHFCDVGGVCSAFPPSLCSCPLVGRSIGTLVRGPHITSIQPQTPHRGSSPKRTPTSSVSNSYINLATHNRHTSLHHNSNSSRGGRHREQLHPNNHCSCQTGGRRRPTLPPGECTILTVSASMMCFVPFVGVWGCFESSCAGVLVLFTLRVFCF